MPPRKSTPEKDDFATIKKKKKNSEFTDSLSMIDAVFLHCN